MRTASAMQHETPSAGPEAHDHSSRLTACCGIAYIGFAYASAAALATSEAAAIQVSDSWRIFPMREIYSQKNHILPLDLQLCAHMTGSSGSGVIHPFTPVSGLKLDHLPKTPLSASQTNHAHDLGFFTTPHCPKPIMPKSLGPSQTTLGPAQRESISGTTPPRNMRSASVTRRKVGDVTNKYARRYPASLVMAGCEFVDVAEKFAN